MCPVCSKVMLTEQPHTHYLIRQPRRYGLPDPDPLDVTPADSPLPRFREQRRRSRWNCSVIALVAALIVFWGTVLFVAVNVFAAPRSVPVQPAQSGAPQAGDTTLTTERKADRGMAGSSGGSYGAPQPAAASQPASPDVSVPAQATLHRMAEGASEPAPVLQQTAISSGVASWYHARGDQGAVPWWRPGQSPVWAIVSRFADGRTRNVTILITGWCQCLVGQPGERLIDLSDGAFAQLAPLSAGLIQVTLEVGTAGPGLPATDGSE